MVPNGHLERAGEAPFARTRAAGWDTRWGTAGPGTSCTSWVHQEAHPQLLLGGECRAGVGEVAAAGHTVAVAGLLLAEGQTTVDGAGG